MYTLCIYYIQYTYKHKICIGVKKDIIKKSFTLNPTVIMNGNKNK